MVSCCTFGECLIELVDGDWSLALAHRNVRNVDPMSVANGEHGGRGVDTRRKNEDERTLKWRVIRGGWVGKKVNEKKLIG